MPIRDLESGVGTIQIAFDAHTSREAVAREDVAVVVVEALGAAMKNKVIGFTGGKVPIAQALAAL